MKKSVRVAILISAVALVGIGAAGGMSLLGAHTPGATADEAITDMRGQPVNADLVVAPSAAETKAMNVQQKPGIRLRVPTVGLDVPFAELSMVDGAINPPGFNRAYLVRNLGTTIADPASGTVYVVMHSVRGGGTGPGNYLIDTRTGTSTLRPGATITIGDLHYTVTGSSAVTKTALPHEEAIWANTPGRLVMITCLQKPDGGASVDNMVITATLD